jgi:hypothetical protein
MPKVPLLIGVIVAALAVPSVSAGRQEETPVRLVGTPAVHYTWIERGGARFASFAAVVKLNRALTRAEQRRGRYSLVVAPGLRRSQELPDELFGGGSLGRIGNRGHCYSAEPSQLASRPAPRPRARWRLGIAANERVLGQVKRVTLGSVRPPPSWPLEAARRLGCMR